MLSKQNFNSASASSRQNLSQLFTSRLFYFLLSLVAVERGSVHTSYIDQQNRKIAIANSSKFKFSGGHDGTRWKLNISTNFNFANYNLCMDNWHGNKNVSIITDAITRAYDDVKNAA